MDVSLYLQFEKIRVAFYTIDIETMVIYNLKKYDTLSANKFFYNSIGSKHMVSS